MAAICLLFAGLSLIGCRRDSTSATSNETSNQPKDQAEIGVVLRANPNPVPAGSQTGKTTITWQTGSEAVADVYFFDGKDETLFASGARGSKEADFIKPGSNEFRLYNQGQHKLVTQLTVTMAQSDQK
jgi:hypothetical protein